MNGFWEAEEYHQDYFENNTEQAYCQFVILPKVQKFKEIFRDRLKEGF
jgi:peptide methionine sulfoxide reductase MsrA